MSHHHAPPGLGEPEFFAHDHGGRESPSTRPGYPLHLQGVLLPEGEPRDLWVADGLIRDAGSPIDTHWIDEREDLPRIIRAGRHIARPKRYIRNYAAEVEPEELIAEVARQAVRGDGWVKLVGDWIDRDRGDLAPLWPAEVAAVAIERAHQLGARVTAHCFGEESVQQLVRAGIDGIEHGTGLDAATIELMAERRVALVPTLVNLENFPAFADAGEAKFPAYAAHMRTLHARRFETIGAAIEAGVPAASATAWSEPRSACWPSLAARSSRWVPRPGVPGNGWAPRRWSTAPGPTWWFTQPTHDSILGPPGTPAW